MRHTIIAAGLSVFAGAAAAQTPVLTVYTYDSFVTEWGPGPAVEAAFEETCGCDLQFVAAGDGAALLSRIRLEGERTEADIMLGIDTNLTAAAAETGLFMPHGVDTNGLVLPTAWLDETFVPYNWGFFAFVHNTDLANVPSTFEELAASDISIIIQDPRSSTPGLGLLMWVEAAYGERAPEIWADLADNVVTVTPGWSEAYGLFLEGEADMVLSYTTSPAFHIIVEEDDTKTSAEFNEGHYMQVEVAGILANTDQPELAAQFLDFMLEEQFQSVIPTTNWMYPSALPIDALPPGFETLLRPNTALLFTPEVAAAARDRALAAWQSALSQ